MNYTVLYNPKCGTCGKVKAIFQQHNIQANYYDYTVLGFDEKFLKPIITALVKHGEKALIFRPTAQVKENITAAEILQHLIDNPMDIQRPIIFDSQSGTAFIARPAQTLINHLSNR